jgi:hypothetical protein
MIRLNQGALSLKDISDKRKYPRLLLAHSDSEYKAIQGSQILWPRGGKSQVLDMSYAGIAVEASGKGELLKVGEFIEALLLIENSCGSSRN